MNPTTTAIRSGLARGRIELRQTFTTPQDLWGYLFPTVVLLVVMLVMRGSTIPGTDFSRGTMTLPSVLGVSVAFGGLVNLMQYLTVEREDGTLLRAKATPGGMLGYLVGKVVTVSGMVLVSVAITLIPGMFLFEGLALNTAGAWLTLAWVLAIGLVATMPIGAVFGSLFSNPRNMGIVMLPVMGLVAASGIFYPITGLPEWLQFIVQIFPIYWLGLGMRSALLPDDMALVEIGESWRHLETVGVLSLWAILGLIIAPIVLRRMARRESGSSVAERREKAMQRIA
ncbi:ABC transporter [Prauserella marina]|uniref:ABC-2 type transport system permease protein n=1 Tax=Prauserella marina TaxID=530584 RepID=A0A222VIW8_9PSEU|nr:ABC transporter permease [Prauserella marina]ASR33661.1 ABC transporter [Prauserella marina]PWV82206.1 ABC-2 type transport system permease protein [Prauserella marina]SDD21591.1 ABC-2 type transport system permease protein [Prauserella marina]